MTRAAQSSQRLWSAGASALLAALLMVAPLHAAPAKKVTPRPDSPTHRLLAQESYIRFQATVNDAAASGRFTDVAAFIHFDRDRPTDSYIEVTVPLGDDTITATYERVADNLKRKAWLHTQRYPEARFISRDLERQTHNSYRGYGRLTLRGVTRVVPFHMTLTPGAKGRVRAHAMLTLKRLNFGIGQGEWEATDTVENTVSVHAHIVAVPVEQP